jgi:hypothetical protein
MKYRIHCAEIWGGIDAIESDVCIPCLDTTIFSQGAEGNVRELSAWLYALLAEKMNSLDGAAISAAAVLSFNSMDKPSTSPMPAIPPFSFAAPNPYRMHRLRW